MFTVSWAFVMRTRSAIKLLSRWAIVCAGVLPALALAQAGATSSTSTESTAGCLGAAGTSSGTSTSLFSSAGLASGAGGCTASASSFAYAGVVGATVNTLFSGGGQNGAVIGAGSASWNDGLTAVWPERFTITNLGKLRLTYNIGATGGVSASSSPAGAGAGLAEIKYDFSVGSSSASGKQRWDGEKTVVEGTWGTISGVIELTPTGGSSDDYSFASIGLALSGSAGARAIHYANPQAPVGTSSANAEFGSTLLWKGIVSAQAFDSSGAELELPDGFEVGLIGSQTGFDYWDSAATQPVPEPGTWALMLAGLGLVGSQLRRRG